jgi:thymidylate synthase
VKLSVADIANAPLIHYTLKDDPLRRVRIGSIAQYWEKVLPESVSTDKEGTLSMSYDLQAHAAVVVLARKVQQLEKIINELQSRKA